MTVRAPKPIVPAWYTPESEKTETVPARFKLRGLTTLERLTLSELKIRGGRIFLTPENAENLFATCLLGWEGVFNHDGGPRVLVNNMRENLEALSTDLINELGAEILRLSFLEDDEKKTSSSALKSPEGRSTVLDVPGGGTATTEIPPAIRSGKSKG